MPICRKLRTELYLPRVDTLYAVTQALGLELGAFFQRLSDEAELTRRRKLGR